MEGARQRMAQNCAAMRGIARQDCARARRTVHLAERLVEGLVAVAHLLHDERLRVVHLRRPPLELAPRQVGVAQGVALAEVREAVGHRAGAVLVEASAVLEVRSADALLGLERLEVRRRAARTELAPTPAASAAPSARATTTPAAACAATAAPWARSPARARRARRARRVEGEGARRVEAARAEVVGEGRARRAASSAGRRPCSCRTTSSRRRRRSRTWRGRPPAP